MKGALWIAAFALLASGCDRHGAAASGAASASAPSASASAAAPPQDRLSALLAAEHRRAASLVTSVDQQSRDVAVRRAAARALSRIGGDAARPGLLRALADEDADVVAWAAYGLGFTCKGHEKETASALVARALDAPEAHPAQPAPAGSASASPEATPPSAPKLDPGWAIARALGKCAAEESEPTLVAWLAGPRPRAVAAAFALGDVAIAKQKLREETFAALLNLAAGSAATPPVPEALFPIGRVEHVPPSVVDRLREVATARLGEPGPARYFAVRALSRANDDAAVELQRVLVTPGTFTAAERSEAAAALKRMPRIGLRLLGEALPKLIPSSDPIAATGLISEDLGPLLNALEILGDAGHGEKGDKDKKDEHAFGASAKKALGELAAFPVPKEAPAPIVRRVAWIRCLAAKALAGSNFRDKALDACDVEPAPTGDAAPASPEGLPATTIGARTVVEVIGRAPLEGARLAAFRTYATTGELRARETALEMLAEHEEIADVTDLLAMALSDKRAGLIGTAAEVISKKPQRASAAPAKATKKRRKKKGRVDVDEPVVEANAPSPEIVKALLTLLGDPAHASDPELVDGVIDAVGALGLKDAKARLDELCHGTYPTTREHAQKALGLLGDKTTCDAPAEGGAEPDELAHLVNGPVTLSFDTDVGALSMTLDADLAPAMVARVVKLARRGFYDGVIVHRVVPGFVTQFGAPDGDGFGGPPDAPALRCETSPVPFELGVVGVALAGRDTGSSQLFVMHATHPHLDGGYAVVGKATGAWAAFVDGDRIRKVTVSP